MKEPVAGVVLFCLFENYNQEYVGAEIFQRVFFNGRGVHKLDVYIDKLCNSIEDVITGKKYDTDVVPVTADDFKIIIKKNGWRFNWKSEFRVKNRQLFKLVIKDDSVIQGLISVELKDTYIELHLIETAPHNYGRFKFFFGAPANLIAYICKKSFESGFNGYVAFMAKTNLISHYETTFGAELIFRNRMCISEESAKKLVNLYYHNYFHESSG